MKISLVAVFIAACIVLIIIGYLLNRVGAEQYPTIGSLDFNTYDPTQEFLSLHITEDIDLDDPPEYVLVKVNVYTREEGSITKDGSKS